MEGNASVYQVNLVSRISGEGRAEFLRTWGPDFDQKRAGLEGGRGRVGQNNIIYRIYMCMFMCMLCCNEKCPHYPL